MLCNYSLQNSIDKAGSTTLFSSEGAFSKVGLSTEKLNILINVSDGKENENNVDVTGWMLTSFYV